MEAFSFRQTDIQNILSRAYSLVPGIAKVMSISCPAEGEKPEIYYIDSPKTNSPLEKIHPDAKAIEKIISLQNEKINFIWYSNDEMPFSIEKPKIKLLDVFNELEKNILMLSVSGEFGKLNDLYFFYFNENISNFAITHSKKPLNQENKLIVGSLLYNSITTILDILRKDKIAFHSFRNSVIHLIQDMESATAIINNFQEKHHEVMLNYAREVIQELSASYGNISFELSKNAIDKIKKFDGDIASLKDAISNALLFASSLSIGEDKDEIFIEGFHLIFPEAKKTEPRKVAQEPASRQTKTFLWLDSLEEAATIVHKQKKPLTGTNVGKAFEKPVTAPAISDKLKNRQNTIKELFITHPDRWVLVKNEFKPLMNILTNQ